MQLDQTITYLPDFHRLGLGRTHLLHHIIETGDAAPIKQKYHAVSPAIQKEMYAEIDRMLKLDVIEESVSPWSSPMALVRKRNGKVRLCLDARKLNSVTKKDAFPIPLVDGLLGRLDKTEYISKLDLKDAFWQIALDPASKEKTAFAIPGRPLYQFKVMPFGLCNAPQSLCRLMSKVIPHHLQDRVFVYLDDLLIATASFDEHLSLLEDVAGRLAKAGLTINVEKCQFLLSETEYLGHLVGVGGLRADPDRVRGITEFPRPKNVRQVRRFLGMAGWYRRFVRGYADLSAPLTELLKKGKRFNWTKDVQEAFEKIKSCLISSPVLIPPDFSKRFYIQCDASSTGIGAVLFQRDDEGLDHPISFMSRKLNCAQRNYAVTELECLAAVMAIKKYRAYVEGLPFTVITDHASLTWLMSLKDAHGKLARWSLLLQGFNFDLEYRKGSQNVVPDALSRVHMDSFSLSLEPFRIDLNSASFTSPSYLSLIEDAKISAKKSNLIVIEGKIYINTVPKPSTSSDFDLTSWKLVVPEDLRSSLISSAHSLPTSGHPGIKKTISLLRRFFYWPQLTYDVRSFIQECEECKRNKAPNYCTRPPLSSLPITSRPWQRIYLDFLGPYPRTRSGNTYIFILVDHFSKFVITTPLRKATGVDVVRVLVNQVFLMFGVPEVIVTDNGKQFVSKLLQELCEKYGIRHIFTPKYSPQANASERVNRTLLAALRAYIKDDQRSWDVNLNAVTFALRNTTHSSTGYSPHFIVFGQHPICHGSMYPLLKQLQAIAGNHLSLEDKPYDLSVIFSKVQSNLESAAQTSHRYQNLRSKLPIITVGQHVYVRNFVQSKASDQFAAKLAPKFLKGKVIQMIGNVSCEVVDDCNNSMGIYHLKDLKI